MGEDGGGFTFDVIQEAVKLGANQSRMGVTVDKPNPGQMPGGSVDSAL